MLVSARRCIGELLHPGCWRALQGCAQEGLADTGSVPCPACSHHAACTQVPFPELLEPDMFSFTGARLLKWVSEKKPVVPGT